MRNSFCVVVSVGAQLPVQSQERVAQSFFSPVTAWTEAEVCPPGLLFLWTIQAVSQGQSEPQTRPDKPWQDRRL